MASGALGKEYEDGENIINQNDLGNCMYVIQSGRVEIYQTHNNREIRLAILEEGDFFGEMSKRIRALDSKHTRISAADRRNWNTRPDKIEKESA